jgi:valyl-tRNA synthetase
VETPQDTPSEGVITSVLPVGRVVLPMAGMFDLEAERTRLNRQIEQAREDVLRLEQKLANEQFRERAPAEIVQQEQDRLVSSRGRLEGLEHSLAEIA